jgi:hypothetical protein
VNSLDDLPSNSPTSSFPQLVLLQELHRPLELLPLQELHRPLELLPLQELHRPLELLPLQELLHLQLEHLEHQLVRPYLLS